ncbi:Lon protease C-terminal proteolytic domain-containing protein [Lactarius akahatsu]|uniref:Lon protease C-terminal proteolytic domain-containing protein n=1 Tax=Lactarius akahatsu TaxID=416441 RepID=A0AAD4QBP0_9AGAM|nr:Lon protease C-terminal proteolytic domain-containing protein [Lactarius akahatsu]
MQLQRLEPGNTDLHGTGSGVEDEYELDLLICRVDTLPDAEHGVVRTYPEWLTSLPWTPPATASETLTRSDFLTNSKSQLDADHYGLEKVNCRLMEFLAVVRLRALIAQEAETEQAKAQEVTLKKVTDDPTAGTNEADGQKGNACRALIKAGEIPALPQVLAPVPPSQSLSGLRVSRPQFYSRRSGRRARALGRPFQRIALGGVRDEAEIRGHRRTYVASGPGLLAQALRKVTRMDPVLLLFNDSNDGRDEIDKVGQSNYHGDPSAALLEVLDPEQNVAFNLNVPIDLSQTLFICTTNSLDTISPPFLSQCEETQLSGYTHDKKLHIARQFLPPKQLTQRAFRASRSADRAGAAQNGHALHAGGRTDELEKILGLSRYDGEDREREARRGVVWGVVVTGIDEGEIMPVESIAIRGSGHLKLTDSLGDVFKESAELALSWVKTHSYDLGITIKRAQDPLRIPDTIIDVHLHVPADAQKKDESSAGVAMVQTDMSSPRDWTGMRDGIALDGQITLRGRVSLVGGVKEMVLGANKVIVPWANRKDVEHDVPKEVQARMQFVFARTVREVLDAAFGRGTPPWHTLMPVVERMRGGPDMEYYGPVAQLRNIVVKGCHPTTAPAAIIHTRSKRGGISGELL